MSKGTLNKVILIGNLGADPESRFMPSGGQVTNARLATTEVWKDQQGQQQERTEWHSVVFYGKLAEIVGQYPKKGHKLYIEGSIRTRKWQDKNGQDRYSTEIIANEMQMLDRGVAQGGGMGSHESPGGYQPPARPAASAPAPAAPAHAGSEEPFFDDDVPF